MSVTKAERLERAFEQLRKKYKGRLTRQIVVREAQRKTSPLHKEFDWNLKRAAMQHWLDRAGDLMTRYVTVRVLERKTTMRFPMYIRDATLPSNQAGYISTREKIDRSAAEKQIEAELDRIESQVERGRAIASAFDLHNPGIAALFEQLLETVCKCRGLLGGGRGGGGGDDREAA